MELNYTRNSNKITTSVLVKVSLLGVLAFLLMFVRAPIFFAPPFMDVDVSEMPALIAAFSMGPFAGFLTVLLKIILKTLFSGTSTQYVGELSNLIVSSAFVITAGWFYRRHKTLRGAVVALILGVIVMATLATFSNYFVIFPLYGKLMGISMQQFADGVKAINPLVSDFRTLMLFAIVPFNIVKGVLTSLLTLILYKKVSKFLFR